MFWPWTRAARNRKNCFHHDIGGNPSNTKPAVSYIKQELIEMGKAKMFWCDKGQGGCGQMWFV